MKYLVTHEILYRLTVDARNEKEAIPVSPWRAAGLAGEVGPLEGKS